ncbi:MAG: alanine--tRNA ligase [Gammaproteobacteria bacterium]
MNDNNSSKAIRRQFLQYFNERGHEIVPSSPLVPANDPTLLFTNAGMVQFKDVFLGTDKRPYKRAATSQRCVRAGGKHNDLENVGYTARHHTFFEMMGNFSFGDYFKREAIHYCWELLTEKFALPPERLWVTVFEEDDEAERIWFEDIGVDRARFSRCGAGDNFWSMGDTGPCGPCSEVFYDHGPEVAGGPPGSPDEDGDRYIEIWNLVFMQYNRDTSGELTPLPKPSVDTGMGLERLAAVLQGVHSNYDTDLFRALIGAAAEATHATTLDDKSLRVIADHIRACAFLICDGVVPSNETRGFVLRRIIRRAIRHGNRLGVKEPFFHTLVAALEREMGEAYPELAQKRSIVEQVLRQEEEQFAETLDQGMRILEQSIADLPGKEIPGETVFRLHDTYGFPDDLTADIARERGLTVDRQGFEEAMRKQRDQAREAGNWSAKQTEGLALECTSEFSGYEGLNAHGTVLAMFTDDDVPVDALGPEDQGKVVLSKTPFYGQSGGQVGDHGDLVGKNTRFQVRDTLLGGEAIVHIGVVTEGSIKVGDELSARVDGARRAAVARNHSATHLLHAALRKVLGEHVQQKGSLVAPDRLRFDFSHFEPVSPEQLGDIETTVNGWILANDEVDIHVMALEDARRSGAIALFGEKYADPVRVLSIGEHSVELCGGTHVTRSGDIGLFKLVSEVGSAAGVRRVEAVTGDGALAWLARGEDQLSRIAALLKTDREGAADKTVQLLARNRELERDLERLQARLAASHGDGLAAQAVEIGGVKVLAAKLDGVSAKGLRNILDQLKNKLGSAAVVLAVVEGEKVNLVAGVTNDATDRLKAGALVNFVAQQVGGRGGGRADMAQAGGTEPAHVDQAMSSVPNWVREQLGARQ